MDFDSYCRTVFNHSGVLNDITGFLLLIPASRHVGMWLIRKLINWGRGEIRVGRWNL